MSLSVLRYPVVMQMSCVVSRDAMSCYVMSCHIAIRARDLVHAHVMSCHVMQM